MNAAQYVEQLRSLLPPGRALDDAGQGMLTKLLSGMSQELARVDASAWALIDESLPDSAVQLLPDWERVCALPDDCTPSGQTISQRQQAVVARITGNGTPSIPYLTDLATQLGYTVTIVRRRAFQCGMSCGAPLGGFDWNFAWEVQAPLYSVTRFLAGQGRAGDPLASWQNNVLECVMLQHAPAHTNPIFQYWQTFTDTQFAVADGTTQDLQLTDGQGNAVTTNVNVSAIYCSDWQGLQLLSTQPRTNLFYNSSNLTTENAYESGVSVTPSATVASSGDTLYRVAPTTNVASNYPALQFRVPNPVGFGSALAITMRMLFRAAELDYSTVGTMCTKPGAGGNYFPSGGSAKIVNGPGAISGHAGAWNITGLSSSQDTLIEFTDTYASTASDTVGLTGLLFPWNYPASIADDTKGVLCTTVDIYMGNSAGVHIPTTSAAVTVTDYTLKNAGQVHLGQLPTVGAVFTWDGNTQPSY